MAHDGLACEASTGSTALRERKKSAEDSAPKRKSVQFDEEVEVLEFSRLLGGSGGVPTDGTWVTLGLGQACCWWWLWEGWG
eukprot:symbB.v1.2.039223.t1/scaffold6422.1/size18234/2